MPGLENTEFLFSSYFPLVFNPNEKASAEDSVSSCHKSVCEIPNVIV